MNPEVRLKKLAPDEVLGPYLGEISSVWTGADEDRLREILSRQAERRAFRFLISQSEGGQLTGFSYGFVGAPGQWWHDAVAAEMDEEARKRWLPDGHFELTELHVHPGFRRRGVGGRLHDALLDGLASPTSVLTTQTGNEAALGLYRGRGWEVVVPRLFFPTDPNQSFCVMGKDLG